MAFPVGPYSKPGSWKEQENLASWLGKQAMTSLWGPESPRKDSSTLWVLAGVWLVNGWPLRARGWGLGREP